MTKIFITIPWFLPAYRAGGPVQSIANLIREYTNGVEYYIFCGDTDVNGAELKDISTRGWTVFNDHTHVWYATPEKTSETLVKQVAKVKPDILFIVGMFSWHYNIVPLLYCKGPRKIISSRGMLHPGALTQKKWKKKIYLQIFKLLEYQHKTDFHATDKQEAKFIGKYFGDLAQIFTASNFPNTIGALPLPKKEVGSLRLATIALISPMKNILSVLMAFETSTDLIQYDIYGAVKDENYWDECKMQIKKLPENITVIVHREIEPAKVKDALHDAHVFILPSKSENFGHALYEALSAGRPLITSHHTPWNCLQSAHAGMNVSMESLTELSAAIHFFAAMDAETLNQWHCGAIDYAEKSVDVEKIREDYGMMFGASTSSN
ncbi:MAG: glycosyltransferase [Ginsengibacter sp.]